MIDEQTIQARIVALEIEQERYIATANQQIAAYHAVIGELKRLIAQPEDTLVTKSLES